MQGASNIWDFHMDLHGPNNLLDLPKVPGCPAKIYPRGQLSMKKGRHRKYQLYWILSSTTYIHFSSSRWFKRGRDMKQTKVKHVSLKTNPEVSHNLHLIFRIFSCKTMEAVKKSITHNNHFLFLMLHNSYLGLVFG